ncbi:methyltransferase domain-containing protein [Pseudoroseomonas wenyumeiae]
MLCAMPAELGPQYSWPRGGPSLSTLVEETELPFPDFCFDDVLLVHGLETAENGRRLLREVWRVLKEDGRLLVVVPNRRGIWAHSDTTPFGQGRPYSPGRSPACSAAPCSRWSGGAARCSSRPSRTGCCCAAPGSGNAPGARWCRASRA